MFLTLLSNKKLNYSDGSSNNPFIQATINVVLSYVQPKKNYNLEITIYSDDGYHSQDQTTDPTNELELEASDDLDDHPSSSDTKASNEALFVDAHEPTEEAAAILQQSIDQANAQLKASTLEDTNSIKTGADKHANPSDKEQPKEQSIKKSDDATTKKSTITNSTRQNSRFHKHNLPIHKVPKTGLGSSAALTAVATACIYAFYLSEEGSKFDVSSRSHLDKIHNMAQVAHCTAQGKIGSGFDIASAVYGSIVYRRFPPEVVSSVIDTKASDEYCQAIKKLVDSPHGNKETWDSLRLENCSMPPGISVLMGDVRGGSETPKLVGNVLQWRKENPEQALDIWKRLNTANMGLVSILDEMREFHNMNSDEYKELLRKHSRAANDPTPREPSSVSDNMDLILLIKQHIREIRECLRAMGEASNVPIEPKSQTELLDRCTNELPGVLGGVVPGAGGFDAICLLVVSSCIEEIKNKSVEPPLPITWLDLKEQPLGLMEEDPLHEDYSNLA